MLRSLARLVSILFHPLLILTYMLVLLLLINPYSFGVNQIGEQSTLILLVFLSTFMIPAFSVLMMKFLGMVDSLELKSNQERIGPYIITGIFYLWIFINFKNNSRIPLAFTSFVLGSTIALFLAFFINIFSKISAHTVGMGGLTGMIAIIMLLFNYDSFTVELPLLGILQLSMNSVFMAVIVMAGSVGTARLLLKAHEPKDLYGGFLVGFSAQFIALQFIF